MQYSLGACAGCAGQGGRGRRPTSVCRSCPGQEKDGDWLACSGVGRCTFTSAAAYCVCPPGLVGAACNVTHIACSPACEHGVCDYGTGKCKCHPNYMGADCSTTCGTKRFPYVLTNWVSIGGHTGSYNDDNPTADTSARSEALDCICKKEMPSWARSTTGGYWGQGTLNYVDTSGTHDSTYPCINSGCSDIWGCNYFERFTCAYNKANPECTAN